MFEYTTKEILLWIFASIGGVAGLVKAFTAVTARFDKRKELRKAQQLLEASESAEFRRIKLEEEKVDEGIWEAVAKEKQNEIAGLKDDLQKERIAHSTTKQTARETLDNLYTMFARLRVAKIPDEVVDIIAEKVDMAKAEIRRGRDALG